MKNFLKKSGWTDILMSLIFAAIGIFMIVKTNSATTIISYIIGGIFIISGIVKIIDYFVSKGSYDFYNNDLVYGIIAVIIGIVTICYSGFVESVFRIIIGIWIVYSGLLRLSLSLKLHKAKIAMWGMALVLALIMIIAGMYMILTNGALVLTIGIIILVYSIMDLIESAIFIKYVDKLM